MSTSTIYTIDSKFNGFVKNEYKNSWWFSPVVWNVLLDKYMHDDIQTPFGFKKSIIGWDGEELNKKLNQLMNSCDNFSDRICWEITNQQIFFTKDKEQIAKALKDFSQMNKEFHKDSEGISVLTYEHILERFNAIADDILGINEKHYPYFVFKNTSVDDNVEFWFEKYVKEADEYTSRTLKELNEYVTEFVKIKDSKIQGFISNLDYFNKQHEKFA
ncbi:hypothetical protein [Bacillus paralicheniformis]|uniref:hypothetical protein n=1 Tax=Bacillus paralicheniformis TaxID=1648923 RepID=UPI00189FB91D|nr:hypothetical protein [Bacillus paralicheniformis]